VDVSLQIAPLLVDSAKVGYVFTFRDIGEHKQTEAKLEHDAMHDVLTGLPNRALFLDRVNLTLSRRLRDPDQGCGVLYIDLDRIQGSQRRLGHAAGDALLIGGCRSASRLACVPRTRLRAWAETSLLYWSRTLSPHTILRLWPAASCRRWSGPSTSLGTRSAPAPASAPPWPGPITANLRSSAPRRGLCHVPRQAGGGGRYEIFDKHLEISVTSQQERERELRTAVDKRQFRFPYQPIYRLVGGKIEGFESSPACAGPTVSWITSAICLRWPRTPPFHSYGAEMLDAACAQLRVWSDRLPEQELIVTVNLTRRQLYHPDLIAHLMKGSCGERGRPFAAHFRGAGERVQRGPRCGGRHSAAPGGLPSARSHRRFRRQPRAAESPGEPSRGHGQTRPQADCGRTFAGPAIAGCAGVAHSPRQHIGPARSSLRESRPRNSSRALVRMGCALGQGPLLSEPLWTGAGPRAGRGRLKRAGKELVIVTGISGAGKASALKAFEDLGFHCVDNLPLELLPDFAGLVSKSAEVERAAIVVDVREGATLDRLPEILKSVKKLLPRAWSFSTRRTRCWSGATPRPAGRIRWAARRRSRAPSSKSGNCSTPSATSPTR
jgi:hypothetical protein